mgnify:CR=1 FL=1
MLVLRLDEGDIGGLEEGEFVAEQEDQQEQFVEQGKLLSKLAYPSCIAYNGNN